MEVRIKIKKVWTYVHETKLNMNWYPDIRDDIVWGAEQTGF